MERGRGEGEWVWWSERLVLWIEERREDGGEGREAGGKGGRQGRGLVHG